MIASTRGCASPLRFTRKQSSGQAMSDTAVTWTYRAEIEMRIAKCRSLLRRVSTESGEQHVNKMIAELEGELRKMDQ